MFSLIISKLWASIPNCLTMANSNTAYTLRRHADGTPVKGAARKRRAARRAARREEALSLLIVEADLHHGALVEDNTSTMGPEPQYTTFEGGESDLPAFIAPKWLRAAWKVLTIRVW